ncbi:preprotein translocase subunit SecE [Roseomonas xinghualingensis]|uniref:preprotein translocase subunit SecE n=1 Tax=Roseomonas xinghualingensis TaxID=2986475 RepID=UPI0021F23E89|nr:preprotein translocase subunit SecE [Roseomonas sp. SXEYE001]MCV4208835.1 preprotein translocase subunit SecE [Roseomonas sp. SXEYE001]
MAEAQQHIDYVEVKAQDILAERQNGWVMFTRATTWTIIATVVLLVALKVFWG